MLVLGRSKALSVYVRTHASTTVGNIKDGTYTLYYTYGSRFSVCQGRFTSGATYWRDDKPLTFISPPGQFTAWTVTLYAVNGNAPSTQISPGNFPAP